MKLLGTFLMVAGWLVVLCSFALFSGPAARAVLTAVGAGVEVVGLLVACRKETR